MRQHFPENSNNPGLNFSAGCGMYFLTSKPKLCKKVYFRAIKFGTGRFLKRCLL